MLRFSALISISLSILVQRIFSEEIFLRSLIFSNSISIIIWQLSILKKLFFSLHFLYFCKYLALTHPYSHVPDSSAMLNERIHFAYEFFSVFLPTILHWLLFKIMHLLMQKNLQPFISFCCLSPGRGLSVPLIFIDQFLRLNEFFNFYKYKVLYDYE